MAIKSPVKSASKTHNYYSKLIKDGSSIYANILSIYKKKLKIFNYFEKI
jgi:hypothetical protein